MRTSSLLPASVLFALVAGAFCAPAANALLPAGLPAEGTASWYGLPFHGRKTASGEVFDRFSYSAAHRTLPFGTILMVNNLDNGQRAVVRVNDRGPFVKDRLIDLSEAAAAQLGMLGTGTARVRIEAAPMMAPGPVGGRALMAGEAGPAGKAPPEEKAPAAGAGSVELCDIRVASFSKRDNAVRALERLRADGFRPEEETSGGYTRISLRALPAAKAEDIRKRLAELGFPRVMMSFYEGPE
jgi:rare lipoprotein A